MAIEWNQQDGVYTYGDWKLTVTFTDPPSLERVYWLEGPGFSQQVNTRGGVYTALDISEAVISLTS